MIENTTTTEKSQFRIKNIPDEVQSQNPLTTTEITQKTFLQLKTKPFSKLCKILIILFECAAIFALGIFFYTNIVPIFKSNADSSQQNLQTEQNDDKDFFDEPYVQGDPTEEIFDLVKLNSSSALCLDGSSGSYYISRNGDPERILLFFQDGGWCGGNNFQNTFYACYQRSQSWQGSSKFIPSIWLHQKNVFSKHPDNYFRNWKKIQLNYCDGTGHQGTRKQPVKMGDKLIYFRGHNITTENLEDIQKKLGLFSKAKKVVVSGLSAGGLAVFTWANYIKERVKNGKVYAIADSGIFYDAQSAQTNSHFYRDILTSFMKLSNEEIDPPVPQCIRDYPSSKVDCMLAQNLHKHLKVPLFVTQSLFDTWSIQKILGINCNNFETCSKVSDEEKLIVRSYSRNVMDVLNEIGKKPGNAVFGIGCMLHGMLYYESYISSNYTIPAASNLTFSKAIQQWFKHPNENNFHMDQDQWPSNAGCYNK